MEDPRVQALFKQSRHKSLFVVVISEVSYELGKETIRFTGNIYHIIKLNNYRDVQKFYRDKNSMVMILNKFKYLNSTCWRENHFPFTVDMTEDKYTGRYRLG